MKTEWQQALGKMVYGIYVLTTGNGTAINGMVASWVSQVSHDPPLIMAAVHPNRYCHALIRQSGAFVLHVIAKDRKDFLSRFKGPNPTAKFSGLEWRKGKTGCPVLPDCIAYLECAVKESLQPGNHTLFIGEVVAGRLTADADALDTGDYDGVYTGKA
ncbi:MULTISPECIES: flavin reductase family protein [Desulfococcus]|jgi:flavin reductase (DIM6/NTAB) family NADH-FMN oxidoreductase RutF|uniref:Flavin reductase domain protein FMN-binding protein n=1 Tax=Desulfococcus multivorans DSM 2059 TaxID=1121405 RepID=S7UP85_DESML|nr:flavin reductase family protein [Desulfococcus multivorans]AOY59789.1 NAD(P)H-flavin oxidoreductase [Desulfococcus multivorans]AQV01959.1 flavin reductase [Desulfococcus multivorans]EPR35789.1 flavin reductase domain protein FMN-binding protein [Desulfococcus multivorans DSM 2059]MDX9818823.1 flavin reductase family protein [Desulfococcus multivorans]SJZ33258.1 NADH-FMN oxidoreductase RutF, flavin reductase (DIM6/NTAB) family [Desulfococcus multivorans DSM 2059]